MKSQPDTKMEPEVKVMALVVLLTVLWMSLLAPALGAGSGPTLSDEVLRRGQGEFTSCRRKNVSLGTTFSCWGVITWTGGQKQSGNVTATQDLTGKTAEVVERTIEDGSRRKSRPDGWRAGEKVLVTAAHGHTPWTVWWYQVIGVLVIWGGATFYLQHQERKSRLRTGT